MRGIKSNTGKWYKKSPLSVTDNNNFLEKSRFQESTSKSREIDLTNVKTPALYQVLLNHKKEEISTQSFLR